MFDGVIESGYFNDPAAIGESRYAEMSMSRMGYVITDQSANQIFNELKNRRLVEDSQDGISIPMQECVRNLILVILAQILRENGRKSGFELLPATDRPHLTDSLSFLLAKPGMPSASRFVALDTYAVGADLSAVPFDEILS